LISGAINKYIYHQSLFVKKKHKIYAKTKGHRKYRKRKRDREKKEKILTQTNKNVIFFHTVLIQDL